MNRRLEVRILSSTRPLRGLVLTRSRCLPGRLRALVVNYSVHTGRFTKAPSPILQARAGLGVLPT